MKIVNILYSVTLFFLLLGAGLSNAAEKDSDIVFKWAFLLTKGGQSELVIDPGTITSVTEDDMLHIYIEPENEVYFYLFLLSTAKDLDLLYPLHPRYYVKNPPAKGKIHLPDTYNAYHFDNKKGVEKFYFLASATRLMELESLTAEYLHVEGNKGEQKAKVLDAIKQIRRKHAQLTSTAEKGVSIAGTIKTRAIRPAEKSHPTYIEAEQFYSKTIRFKHE